MDECCRNCAHFDEEYLFCWRYGFHAPKEGKCSSYILKKET